LNNIKELYYDYNYRFRRFMKIITIYILIFKNLKELGYQIKNNTLDIINDIYNCDLNKNNLNKKEVIKKYNYTVKNLKDLKYDYIDFNIIPENIYDYKKDNNFDFNKIINKYNDYSQLLLKNNKKSRNNNILLFSIYSIYFDNINDFCNLYSIKKKSMTDIKKKLKI
jgi:hypothetical protein